MPRLSGLFDSFDNLDQIDASNLVTWLKPAPQIIRLENYLANKILYPQSLPLTALDMKIELAILREALRLNGPKAADAETMLGGNAFLNVTLRKIIIPKYFLRFVPNLTELTLAFVDGLLSGRKKKDFFEDLWTVVLSDQTDEVVGSVVSPQFKDRSDYADFKYLGQVLRIKAGSLAVIPCSRERCEIAYRFSSGKLLGKKESALEISGGTLGLVIDGRNV